eukprot:s5544_g5.t1
MVLGRQNHDCFEEWHFATQLLLLPLQASTCYGASAAARSLLDECLRTTFGRHLRGSRGRRPEAEATSDEVHLAKSQPKAGTLGLAGRTEAPHFVLGDFCVRDSLMLEIAWNSGWLLLTEHCYANPFWLARKIPGMSARAWPKGRGKGHQDKDKDKDFHRRRSQGRQEDSERSSNVEGSRTQGQDVENDQWRSSNWTDLPEGWNTDELPVEDWPSPVPWPPQDPAWWADLASQLPAAWGTGAISSARVKGLEAILSPFSEGPGGTESDFDGLQPDPTISPDTFPADPTTLWGYANDGSARKLGGRQWVFAEERPPCEASPTDDFVSAEVLLGRWVDSQGHSIHVLSTDAFNVRLLATLRKTMCPDKHLALKPIRLGGGWQCGHSILDPS